MKFKMKKIQIKKPKNPLSNFKIGARLTAGFTIITCLTLLMGVFGVVGLQYIQANDTSLYENETVPLGYLIDANRFIYNTQMKASSASNLDPERAKTVFETVQKSDIDQINEKIQASITENNQATFDRYMEMQKIWYRLVEDIREAAIKGNTSSLATTYTYLNIYFERMKESLDELAASKVEDAKSLSNRNNQTAMLVSIILAGILLFAVGVSVVASVVLTRSIVRPVRRLAQVADKLASGDVDIEIAETGKDELADTMKAFDRMVKNIQNQAMAANSIAQGDLSVEVNPASEKDIMSISLNTMINTLRDLIHEINYTTRQHDLGDIDVVIPEDKFSGDYQVLARGINNMAHGHLQMVQKSMDCVAAFANGDFNAELEQFPGKKAFINERIELLRSNLKAVNGEINRLIEAASAGDLDVRVNTEQFEGDWRKLGEGLNGLIEAIVAPINEAEQVMHRMAVNDYTIEITGEYQGKFQQFAESINSVRNRLLSLQDVFIRMAQGDFSRIEEFEAIGQYSENDQLSPSVLRMMQTINDVIVEAETLADSAVKGNLNVSGNEDKFEGRYKDIIIGMNNILRAINEPLQETLSVLDEMAKGNLSVEMVGTYQGDYEKIKQSVNTTIDNFNELLYDIQNTAEQVASGSRQVSDSAQALSQGSTEQASSVEELTAAMQQIDAQTKQNAQNANRANALSEKAKQDAANGSEQMEILLKSMMDINNASANISKIIKVIDDIAFQTNILALNAAVEAARAGQHGKGFAVVAEEVRNLAARSANAAKETTALIENSIALSSQGAENAHKTAEALKKVVDSISTVSALVNEIAKASDEQAAGISQVNSGILQVSDVTQANSATAEESAAASEELSSQSEVLREMIGKFTLRQREEAAEEPFGYVASASRRSRAAKSSNIVIDLESDNFGKY